MNQSNDPNQTRTPAFVPCEPSPSRLADPTQIGRYRVIRLLGSGGFGRVYLAHDEDLNRSVAIKVPRPERVSGPEDIEAYLNEARILASLDHPHIVPVHDVGRTDDGLCFVVSKFIEGTDLAARIKDNRPGFRESAELVATVADALHFAHTRGLVHRDVKPANILIDVSGNAFLTDLGLALKEEDFGRGAKILGTPAYMSPEQARGEGHRVDGRSDIFSLGVVFYELLTGRRPFAATARSELLNLIATTEARPPRQVDETIPKELERICLKALSKRAAERYTTAWDMADDLHLFLNTAADTVSPAARAVPIAAAPGSAQTATPVPSRSKQSDSDQKVIRIVPKGLRSFDQRDAEFFLELLPGPRDRDGLPDSIRFWKDRIEETDPDQTFRVGLIYGPSGCGKSSLVKAGLLPRLAEHVLVEYIEATAAETEARLLRASRKACPDLSPHTGLVDSLMAIRQGRILLPGEKLLLVLDQFEQWLHARRGEENTELVRALRQCDGEHVQAVVMVRDDFWMAATRFMRELEIDLLPDRNILAVDLFDRQHARKVLAAFGTAYGKLPERERDRTRDHHAFLDQAITELAQDGNVISVRLALFAEMMKGKPWSPASLREVGGTEGVGVTFLEETFSSPQANPKHRLHQKAAQAVLKALLPETGTDIKGQMRSERELQEAAAYTDRPRDFAELMHVLDGELRLITPTDPEGLGELGAGSWVVGDDTGDLPGIADGSVFPTTQLPAPNSRYYQLSHDYLVHSLRDWLTRKQRETRRGRAELRLAERAALWQAKPESRHLPSLWEYLTAVWLVPAKNRTAVQQTMLGNAGRIHAVRWGSALAILMMIGLMIWNVIAAERQRSLEQEVVTELDVEQNNRGPAVQYSWSVLDQLPRELLVAELRARYANAEPQHKLALAYAMARYDQVEVSFLVERIERSASEEVDNLALAFGQERQASLEAIHALAQKAAAEKNWRLVARLAVVALHLEDDKIAADMCRIADRPDPIERTIFIDEFPAWHGDIANLAMYCQAQLDDALRSGLCLGLGGIPPGPLTDAERDAWTPVLTQWYETASDSGTHSAAGWALRQWGIDEPVLPATYQPSGGRPWFVNSLGMTLLEIKPGEFVRRAESPHAKDQTVRLTRAFFLSDREISVGQFQQFIDAANYEKEEKPEKWPGAKTQISPTPGHPVQMVDWYDAVLFCNWLSRKEGRTACYERTGKKEKLRNEKGQEVERDEWGLVPSGTGYRLPTEAEWEYCCCAGTTTKFACGSDEEFLRKYAVFRAKSTARCGSKLPNGWGLFDMPGNVWEWCWDGLAKYDAKSPAVDPRGAAAAPDRVFRGGSWPFSADYAGASIRLCEAPGYRNHGLGFRVARGKLMGHGGSGAH